MSELIRNKVLGIKGRNYKSIRAVEITPEGKFLQIKGNASQGKTSVLQMIKAGIQGIDPNAITEGQDAAEILIDMSNASIRRIATRDGEESVVVNDADGNPVKKGGRDLVKMLGQSLCFDPIAWVKLSEKTGKGATEARRQQRQQLLSALPVTLTLEKVRDAVSDLGEDACNAHRALNPDVDFEEHALSVCDALHKSVYDARKEANTRLEDAENRLNLVPPPEKAAPDQDAEALQEAYDKATSEYYQAKGRVDAGEKEAEEIAELEQQVKEYHGPQMKSVQARQQRAEKDLKDTNQKIDSLREQLRKLESDRDAIEEKIDKLRDEEDLALQYHRNERRLEELKAKHAETEPETLQELEAKVARAKDLLERRQAQDAYDKAFNTFSEKKRESEALSDLVKLFRDDLPRQLIEQADLPIDGLSVSEDTVTLHGKPLHLLGTSEQYEVAVAVFSTMYPDTGFLPIDGAESIGSKQRQAIMEIAEKYDLQPIMTILDENDPQPDEHTIVMRNGEAIQEGD